MGRRNLPDGGHEKVIWKRSRDLRLCGGDAP